MADASSQIGYLIRGGLLLDLNGTLDAAVDIRAVPSSRDEMIAHNFAKRFQATTQEDNGAQCFNTAKKNLRSHLQAISDEEGITRVTISGTDAGESTINRRYSDAANRNNCTATASASTDLPIITKMASENYVPAFSSNVVVLGKRIVAIEERTHKESHQNVSTAASRANIRFTDGNTLSVSLNSSVDHSVIVRDSGVKDVPIPVQQSEGTANSNMLSFFSPFPFSELHLSDRFFPKSSLTDSFNSSNSSSSGLFSVKVFDASGCFVVPGLLDCHTHVYQYSTPLGIEVDEFCLKRGVTTVVDAGSAGASTFAGLRKFIAEKSITRVLAFVHIASHGLAAAGCAGFGKGGECDSLNQVDVDQCVSCVQENRDMVVGVKVRLAADITDNGRNEEEAYRRALQAARKAEVPLMVHHAISTIPITKSVDGLSCPGDLAAGDLYTHTFHGYPSSILDPKTWTIPDTVWEAKNRGVLFDVGHGQGSFNWTVLEKCAAAGFWPDTISTDLHCDNLQGPAYDLPTVMTKLLHVGMPFVEVVRAVTVTPARALGISDRVGILAPGREADITILKLESCDVWLEDSAGQRRRVQQRVVPVAVFKGGELFQTCQPPSPWPNEEKAKYLASQWHRQVARDLEMPKFSSD